MLRLLHLSFVINCFCLLARAHAEEIGLGDEAIPSGEAAAISKLLQTQRLLMEKTDATKRGAHPKGHGCVIATFAVASDIADGDLKKGVFVEPRVYESIIRFSNAAFLYDGQPEVHGMAIKLLGVKGKKILDEESDAETQDFVLSDNPVFFAKDIETFAAFLDARVNSALKKDERFMLEFAQKHPGVVQMRDFSRKLPSSLFDNDYWSQTPYRLGAIAVKYSVKHRPENSSGRIDRNSDNYLRDELVEHLMRNKKSASFDFFIQKQTDAAKMPVEDPTIIWTSPEVRVATITIEPQEFDVDGRNKMCEDGLSFTPWHALLEHRPIGGINRGRRVFYEDSSKLRHGKTRVIRQEPTQFE